MKVLWPIALVTYKEGIRSRAILGVLLITLMLLCFGFLLSGMLMRDVGKVAIDFALSSVSLSGLLIVLFSGINMMNKDVERKTIYMILSRPISRSQYMVGKFFGLLMLLAVAVVLIGAAGCGLILAVKLVFPLYSQNIVWGGIFLALLFIYFSLALLTSVSLLFFSFSTNSFMIFIMTLMVYLIGHSLSNVKILVSGGTTLRLGVSPLTRMVVDIAYYLFPNLSFFDIKLQAAHAIPVSGGYVAWVLAYGCLFSLVSLLLACMVFSRREFP